MPIRIFLYLSILLFGLCTHAHAQTQSIDHMTAIVNDSIITQQQVRHEMQKLRLQLHQSHLPIPKESVLRAQALDQLIDKELQLQLAKNAGIEVSDATLDASIDAIAKRNQISVPVLKEKLAAQGIHFNTYRQDVREQMIMSQIQQRQLIPTITITDDEVKKIQSKLKSISPQGEPHYRIIDILLPLPENPSASEINAANVKAQRMIQQVQKGANFAELARQSATESHLPNGGDFGWRTRRELPDLFASKVVNMSKGQIQGPLRAGNGLHLIQLQDVQGGSAVPLHHYTKQTHVRHILLKTDKNTNDEMAKMRLLQLKEQLMAGADFAQVATANSQDTQSSSRGGDLGWVPEGVLDPHFEQTMNQLKINQVGGPVKTAFGWHLIVVLGRKQVEDSDALLANQARGILYQQKIQQALPAWLQQLRGSAYVKKYENN